MIHQLRITHPATGSVQTLTYPTPNARALEMILWSAQPILLEPIDVPEVEQLIEETQRGR